MHHATTDLKFRSCTALSSSSPVIEASKLDDLLPYASLELGSYWGCGQVFIITIRTSIVIGNIGMLIRKDSCLASN